ncbi:ABC transporter substrate-binding protein/permease [Rhizosaccharibacter radicis]|uniref:ABC transporter substrate-binding protein/permease n=1 Tax=Rhizosaccharibacter radicis TaxID=2782605 RepID=A0ABT1VYS9_9PROT|nr:ABC transporter substrate-binding protein/permease [Acetobacteraceae bacterium KSS12]
MPILLLLLSLLLLPVCARADGPPLRWAADAQSGAPFVFHDPADQSVLTGFEYDLMQALGRRLGRTMVFVQNDWDGLIPGLNRGLYDLVIDGIEITPEHEEAVAFSSPYYDTAERIAVRRDAAGLGSIQALRGHTVGTLKDTTSLRLLEAAGGIRIRSYEDETNAYTDLANGRLDAVMLDEPIAQYYAVPDARLRLSGPPVGHLSYGIAMRRDDPALRARVDAALDAMRHDGELRRILQRWNLWTPAMAATDDAAPGPAAAPIAWEHWLKAAAPAATWRDRLRRYASFLPLLGRAALMTLSVSACAMVLAVALGLALALMRRDGAAPLRWIAVGYIEIVRGTPLLIQILFIFYGLPALGVRLDPFLAGVVALGLNYAAYEAENYRAGLQAVPHGQFEAALALNMSHGQALRHVVVPQAFRTVLPVMTNDFISLLKDSSLVSVITLSELSQLYVRLSTTYYDYLGTGLMIGSAYLLLGLPFVRLARLFERRLARAVGGGRF